MSNPNEDRFLPDDYEVPKDENYLKLSKQPETRFRFLQTPIRGYVGWTGGEKKKPVRRQARRDFLAGEIVVDEKNKLRHFWAAAVWNYKLGRVQILEITQSTVQTQITDLSRDADWGNPLGYDLKVVKKGDGMDTEYNVIALPKKPLPDDAAASWALVQSEGFNLHALWAGKDPWGTQGESGGPPTHSDADIPADEDPDSDVPF